MPAFLFAVALAVAAVMILETAGLVSRSPGSRRTGSGLVILLSVIAITQLSNDHNWPYHQKHALHEFALIPMIMAVVLIIVGTVRQIKAVSRR
jgi:hypothetical protein